jgi:rare lipoprotein A
MDRKIGGLRRLAVAWVAVTALAGCTELQFLSQATKEVSGTTATAPGDPSAPDLGPRYKVGDPYQVKGVWYYPKVDYGYVEEGIASWYGPNFHGNATANGAVFDQYKVSAAHRTLPMPSMVRVTNLENGRSIKVIVNDRGPFHQSRIIDLSRRGAQLLGFETKGTALVRVEILEAESLRLASMVPGGPAPSGMTQVADTRPEPPPPSSAPTASVDGEDLAPPPGSDGTTVAASAEPPAEDTAPPEAPTEREDLVEIDANEDVTMVAVAASPDVFIQAGAFSLFDNANRARSQLSYLGPVVVQEYTRSDTPLFRVRLGPVREDANLEQLLVSVIAAGYGDAHIVVDEN